MKLNKINKALLVFLAISINSACSKTTIDSQTTFSAPVKVAPASASVKVAPASAPVKVAPASAPVKVASASAPVKVAPASAPVKVASASAPVKVESINKKINTTINQDSILEINYKLKMNYELQKRQQLISKIGSKNSLVMGVYPEDFSYINNAVYLSRFLSLSNDLSEITNSLVSFSPESSEDLLLGDMKKAKYHLVSAGPGVVNKAMILGYLYEPLVQKKEKIISVVLTKTITNIKEFKDLEKINVGVSAKSLLEDLAKIGLKENGINIKLSNEGLTGKKELLFNLESNNIDAIVIKKELADEIIENNPGKYKYNLTLGISPGYMILVKKDLPEETKKLILSGILSKNKDYEIFNEKSFQDFKIKMDLIK